MDYVKEFPTDKSLIIIGRVAETCSRLGGPLSRQLYKLFLDGKYLELIDFNFDYLEDFSSDDFLYARQIQALFSKQKDIELGIDKEAVAFDTFMKAEDLCLETNRRFRANLPGVSSGVHSVLHCASRKIDCILGDVPDYSELKFSFGPGASTSVKRARSNPRVKIEAPLTCSHEFIPHAKEFLAEFPGWTESKVSKDRNLLLHTSHGKLQFVPKSSKTYRSIGVEPSLNGFGQQGIGKYIRHRLQRAGVDLTDQTRNQKLACQGSIDNSLATVDMSSASDTIAYGMVLHLLPYDWFDFLDRFRTGVVSYKGKDIRLQKFSSMGNSYTFELESLIFYALAFGTCSHLGLSTKNVSVYGDDVIIPVEAMALFEEVLTVCGFIINMKKSFADGPFRESCGADYLDGIDIRPFYLKDRVSVRVLFNMHNWFIRHGEPALAGIIMEYIPSHLQIFGPDGYGDGHLIGTYKLRRNRDLNRWGHEGGFFDTFVASAKRIRMREPTDWVYPLYSIYVSGDSPEKTETQHDVVPGVAFYKRVSIYTLKRGIFVD